MFKPRILAQLNKVNAPIKDLINNAPIVELYGTARVFVENHCGIIIYTQEEIQIKMQYGILIVKGSALILLQIGKEQLVIKGNIESLQLIGR